MLKNSDPPINPFFWTAALGENNNWSHSSVGQSVWLITIRSPVQARMGPFVIAVAGFVEGIRKGCAAALSRAGLLWNLVYMSAIVKLRHVASAVMTVCIQNEEPQQTGSGEERHRPVRPALKIYSALCHASQVSLGE